MKAIKRIAEVILTIIGCLAFVLLTAEADTIGMQMLCTIGSVSILYICIKLMEIIEDYPTDDEYQEAVATWENAEDDYVDNYVEMRQLAREFN